MNSSEPSLVSLQPRKIRTDPIKKNIAYFGASVNALLITDALCSNNFYLAQISYLGLMGFLFGGAILHGNFPKKG